MTPSFPTRRSSDLCIGHVIPLQADAHAGQHRIADGLRIVAAQHRFDAHRAPLALAGERPQRAAAVAGEGEAAMRLEIGRSEEHTSELQSLMRISYDVFSLKKKKHKTKQKTN